MDRIASTIASLIRERMASKEWKWLDRNDTLTLETNGNTYSFKVEQAEAMLKHFERQAKAKPSEHNGGGTGKEQRSKHLQKFYAQCQAMSRENLSDLKRKLTHRVNNSRSYGCGDVPYLTDMECLTIVNELFKPTKVKLVKKEQKIMAKITVVEYSEKAIALFGETKAHRLKLAEMGCKFNRYLSHEGTRQPGWVASKKREAEIRNYINQL